MVASKSKSMRRFPKRRFLGTRLTSLLQIANFGRKKHRRTLLATKNVDANQEDLFNRLTDDLLREVISRLNSRDAIRTGILSSRWKSLWREASLKNIYFEARDMPLDKTCDIVRKFSAFLESRSGTEVESITIRCCIERGLILPILDAWIRFAIKNKVQSLDLNCSLGNPKDIYFLHPEPLYQDGGPSIKHLTVSSGMLLYPTPYRDRFKSLVSLTLKHALVTFYNFRGIFLMCSSLECLTMEECFGLESFEYSNKYPRNAEFLPYVEPLRLKHLSIINCEGMKKVDISKAKCLVSFNIAANSLDKLVCGSNGVTVKKISFHVLNYDPKHLKRIAKAFPHMETLSLNKSFTQGIERLPTIPSIKNFELMLVRQHPENLWPQISNFLKASPSLNKLELRLHLPRLHEKNRWIKNVTFLEDHQHSNLKEVVVYNFGIQARDGELLQKISNCANFLEKIIIHKEPHQQNFSFIDLAQTLPPTIKLQVV